MLGGVGPITPTGHKPQRQFGSRMRTLEELKAKGLISEAEDAGKRSEILRGL